MRERFLTIFWAFIWCFQRCHWTFFLKKNVWVEPKHQHFKPSCAIWVCQEWSPSFTNVKLIWKCGKLYCLLPLFMFYILSRRLLKTSAVVRTSWQQRALLAWPYKYRYSVAKAILRRRTKLNHRAMSFGINFHEDQSKLKYISWIVYWLSY